MKQYSPLQLPFYKITILLVLIILFFSPKNTYSQDYNWRLKGFFGHVTLSGRILDLQILNDSLNGQLSPAIGEPYISLGFGFNRVWKRMMIEGHGNAYMVRKSVASGSLSILEYYTASTSVGFTAFKTMGLFAYPSIGVGAGLAQLKVRKSSEATERYRTWGSFVDGAINLWGVNYIAGDVGSLIDVGLRIGYIYSPLKDQWMIKEYANKPLPVSPEGFYIRLTLGIGAFKPGYDGWDL